MKRLVLALGLLAGVARADEPAGKVLGLTGTFEETFALDGAGGRLALVRTDDAGAHELQVIDVEQKGALMAHVPLGSVDPVSVALSPAGIFVVTRAADGASVEGTLYDPMGKPARKHGPATSLVLVDEGGKATVGGYTARGQVVEVWRAPAAGKAAAVKRTLTKEALAALELVPAYWRGGFARLVGRRLGRYDKARDRQMNDGEGVFDTATGKVTENPIRDLVTWTKVQRERATRWNIEAFVFLDGGKLFGVTTDDRLLPLDVTMGSYEAASLRQHDLADGRVIFSLTIDPLNPEAMARQKRDPEVIHFYRWDGTALERVLEIPTDGRDFVWRAAANRVALLRKHKSFGRGGPELEVWEWRR